MFGNNYIGEVIFASDKLIGQGYNPSDPTADELRIYLPGETGEGITDIEGHFGDGQNESGNIGLGMMEPEASSGDSQLESDGMSGDMWGESDSY